MTKISTYLLASMAGVCLLFTACTEKKPVQAEDINPKFTQYIQEFTMGVISNSDPVRIRFQDPEPEVQVNQLEERDLFSFQPKIEGEAYWIDQYTLEFRPSERLENGESYSVSFNLGKLREVEEDLKNFEFSFSVLPQHLSYMVTEIQARNPNKLEIQQVKGILETSDQSNLDALLNCLSAKADGKPLNLKWTHDQDGLRHYFQIDSVERTIEPREVIFTLDGGPLDLDMNLVDTLVIPGLKEFKLIQVQLVQGEGQEILLNFSDPVSTSQNLNGLVYLESGSRVNLRIDGNQIRVFPQSRLVGNQVVVIDASVQNTMGYKLETGIRRGLSFRNEKPQVALLGDGIIIPKGSPGHFPFKAINLHSVQVRVIEIFPKNMAQFFQSNALNGSNAMLQVGRLVHMKEVKLESDEPLDLGDWNSFSIDLSSLFETKPGSMYRVQIGFLPQHSLYPCPSAISDFPDDLEARIKKAFDGNFDRMGFYNDNFNFYDIPYNYREREDPCKASYYLRNRWVGRNVLASDIGLIVKGGKSNSFHIATNELSTAKPLGGAEITAYTYQGTKISSVKTNGKGMAQLNFESQPYYITATKGNDVTYLKVDDGSALSLSMFNVSGQKLVDGINGFIYGERGVWRPGDSVFLNFILEDPLKTLPANHPVVLELFGPDNELVDRMVRTNPKGRIYSFYTKTGADAPTGNYLAKVKVGGASFSKTVKIETIKPNRLKINISYPDEFIAKEDQKAIEIESKWLHGATASNLEAKVDLNLDRMNTNFKNYPDYVFDDPAKPFYSESRELFSGSLDADGEAIFNPGIEIGNDAPGMLMASLNTRVFESGGGYSVNTTKIPYSPFDGYVGLIIPEGPGWNGALYGDKDNFISIVAVDEKGKPRTTNAVVEIYNINWRWWWHGQDRDELSDYVRNTSRYRIEIDTVEIVNGKLAYNLKSSTRYWGRRLIRVTDLETGHSAGDTYYNSYSYWWSDPEATGPGGAEMLSFSTNKQEYTPGEEVKLTLPKGTKGQVLVSLETGTELLDWFWVDLDGNTNEIKFKTTADMAPNVFVHLSFLQAHNDLNADVPIRMYGVENIRVTNTETKLEPTIEVQEVLEPESTYSIKVSEKNGKPMTYTLAVVDEGLLDITNYKTPDPWTHFYARQALGVKTWDMFKHVMGAFAGDMAGLLALGGGDDMANAEDKKKANRFKPVVTVLGPFILDSRSSKTHELKMPNYIGSVRVMVVAAGAGKSYGAAQETRPVRKPLMVLSTLPRVVSPGETVKLPVTVFAMEDKVKKVDITVRTSDIFSLTESSQTLSFPKPGEDMAYFELKVAERVGIGKVDVVVSSGREKASHSIEIEVRMPSPPLVDITAYVLEPGQSLTTNLNAMGMVGTNEMAVELSTIPPINMDSRLEYLIRYPYGCVEQTTSGVFPQLFLHQIRKLTDSEKSEIQSNVMAGIQRLRNFQRTDGGLAYWPSLDHDANEWGTNYAGHFMLEAKALGYSPPPGFIENWVRFQTNRANRWTQTTDAEGYHYGFSDELIQAYRLFTLALAGKPAVGAMNRMKNLENLSPQSKWRLAAAYALAGQTGVAKEMVRNLTTSFPADYRYYRTYGSNLRDKAMVVETMVILKDFSASKREIEWIAKELSDDTWYSTQSTAYGLLAVSKFARMDGLDSRMVYEVDWNGKKVKETSDQALAVLNYQPNGVEVTPVKVTNTGNGVIFVQVQNTGIPATAEASNIQRKLDMRVTYMDLDGNQISVSKLEQGQDFMVEVRIQNLQDHRVSEMAINQLFASGWEIRNTRLEGRSDPSQASVAEYEDIRDDRVYTFFDLEQNEAKTFRYRLTAAYQGRYYLPPVVAEAMYDNKVYAAKGGQWVEVVKQGGLTP